MLLEYGNNFDSKDIAASAAEACKKYDVSGIEMKLSSQEMNNQETSYNARWNNIEKTMQLNERVKQLKNFVVDSENQIAELLRQLESYEKKVNSNISVGESFAMAVLPGLGHLWTLAKHLDGFADSIGYITNLFNNKGNTLATVKSELINLKNKFNDIDQGLYDMVTKNDTTKINKYSYAVGFLKSSGEIVDSTVSKEKREKLKLLKTKLFSIDADYIILKRRKSTDGPDKFRIRRNHIINSLIDIINDPDVKNAINSMPSGTDKEKYQALLTTDLNVLKNSLNSELSYGVSSDSAAGKLDNYWGQINAIYNKVAEVFKITESNLIPYMAQDLDMSSFLMGTDMQKRVDEYYQSQLQVKELVKATVETSVILALEAVGGNVLAPVVGGALTNCLFELGEQDTNGQFDGTKVFQKTLTGAIDGVSIGKVSGLFKNLIKDGKFACKATGKTLNVSDELLNLKNLPKDAKIMKNVGKARTEIGEDEVKNVLNSAVTGDFDVNNMIGIGLSDGTTRLLCPLGKQGKLLDLSLKAVRPGANSVATSVIKANS